MAGGNPNVGTYAVPPSEPFTITLPPGTLPSNANNSMQLTAQQTNGSPLPSWASFDPQTGTVTGQPPPGYTGKLQVQFVARDSQGNTFSTSASIAVGNAPPSNPSAAPAPASGPSQPPPADSNASANQTPPAAGSTPPGTLSLSSSPTASTPDPNQAQQLAQTLAQELDSRSGNNPTNNSPETQLGLPGSGSPSGGLSSDLFGANVPANTGSNFNDPPASSGLIPSAAQDGRTGGGIASGITQALSQTAGEGETPAANDDSDLPPAVQAAIATGDPIQIAAAINLVAGADSLRAANLAAQVAATAESLSSSNPTAAVAAASAALTVINAVMPATGTTNPAVAAVVASATAVFTTPAVQQSAPAQTMTLAQNTLSTARAQGDPTQIAQVAVQAVNTAQTMTTVTPQAGVQIAALTTAALQAVNQPEVITANTAAANQVASAALQIAASPSLQGNVALNAIQTTAQTLSQEAARISTQNVTGQTSSQSQTQNETAPENTSQNPATTAPSTIVEVDPSNIIIVSPAGGQ